MIKMLLDLLGSNEFYGVSDEIEIAKGKNKLNTSYKEEVQRRKRLKKWQK